MAKDTPAPNTSDPNRMVSGEQQPEDEGALDRALRPTKLDELIGQDAIRDNLRTMIAAAKARGDALDHVLIYGPPGLGKCITGESLVLTNNGIQPLEHFVPADLKANCAAPLSVTVQGLQGRETTSHIYSGGTTSTIQIRTQSGFELEGTPEHPLLVATADGPIWKKLEEIKPDDYVAIAVDTQLWGGPQAIQFQPNYLSAALRSKETDHKVIAIHQQLEAHLSRPPTSLELSFAYAGRRNSVPVALNSAHRLGLKLTDGKRDRSPRLFERVAVEKWQAEWQVPPVLNADLAYVMGLIVGDGHFEQDANFPACDITATEVEIQQSVRAICKDQFGWEPPIRTYDERAPRIRFTQNFGHLMLHLGMSSGLAADKHIPAAVLNSPADVMRGFLQGLFDADGHAWPDGYVEFISKSKLLVKQVQLVLANFGIVAHRRSKQLDAATYWQLFIGGHDAARFFERVGFRLARKQQRMAGLAERTRAATRSSRVPFAHVALACLFDDCGPHPRTLHKRFYHVKKGDRVLTREQLDVYLDLLPATVRTHPAYQIIQSLATPKIYWDCVRTMNPGHAPVYDFCVPGTHSFVANGFYNHNTTLARITSNEMGANLRITSGPAIERQGDLAAILTNLRQGDVLFIDEIHRLNRTVEEILYSAMEDYALDIVIGKGPSARTVRLKLPPITVVGATTRLALMTAPLRERFGAKFRVDFYPVEAIAQIVSRAAKLLQTPIDDDALHEVARRARGTPRVALRLLRRVRDYAQVKSDGRVTAQIAQQALNALEVDTLGLDDLDRRVLLTIISKYNGGPVGLETIGASISEDSETIMDVVEPYLLQLGFLDRTPRGRVATQRAYEHLQVPYTPPVQASLL